jgi:hypothetical protein
MAYNWQLPNWLNFKYQLEEFEINYTNFLKKLDW